MSDALETHLKREKYWKAITTFEIKNSRDAIGFWRARCIRTKRGEHLHINVDELLDDQTLEAHLKETAKWYEDELLSFRPTLPNADNPAWNTDGPFFLYLMTDETGLHKLGESRSPLNRRRSFGLYCRLLRAWDYELLNARLFSETLLLKRYQEFQVPHRKFGGKEWFDFPDDIVSELVSSHLGAAIDLSCLSPLVLGFEPPDDL